MEGAEVITDPSNPYLAWLLHLVASPPLVAMLMLMMIIDSVSGIVAAVKERKLSSKIGFVGMMKKAAMLLVVGMAAVVETTFHSSIPENLRAQFYIPLAKFTAGFFLLNEALSVLENARRAGVPLPAFLTKGLAGAQDRISNWGRPDVRTTKDFIEP